MLVFIDSPKLIGKGQSASSSKRNSFPPKRNTQRRPMSVNPTSSAHTIVVVKEAKLPQTSDKDEDLLRLQVCFYNYFSI